MSPLITSTGPPGRSSSVSPPAVPKGVASRRYDSRAPNRLPVPQNASISSVK